MIFFKGNMFFSSILVERAGVGGGTAVVRFVARAAVPPRAAPPTITVSFPDAAAVGEPEQQRIERCTAAAEALIEQLYAQISRQ